MKNSKVLFGFLSIVFLFSLTVQAGTVNVSLDPTNWSTFGTVTSSYTKQNVSGNLRFTCNTYRGYIGFRSNEIFNLQGGTVRYKWRVYSSGNDYCWTRNGISQAYGFGRYFNLNHVWDTGLLINPNTWIYTELIFNENKTYTWNYSYTGYGQGGVFVGSGTLAQAGYDALTSAYIVNQGGDNYTTPFYYEFSEIKVTPKYKFLSADINAPATESYYEPNKPVTFDSNTYGGDKPYTYEWSSDIDGIINNAKKFSISTLSLGRHHITLSCQDSNAVVATDSIYVYIIQPPIIEAIGNATIREGVSYTGPQPVLSQGTYITWQLVAGPPGMTINSSTGVVSWLNPTLNEAGITVTIKALNGVGSSQQSRQLFVLRPPVITDITDESVRMDDSYTGPMPVLTQGSLPVSWSLISSPSGMTIDPLTGQVSWSSAAIEGVQTITIRATNAVGTNDKSWHLKVWKPPVINAIGDSAIEMGIAYAGPVPTLSAGTLPVEWTLSAGPTGMTINAATGIVSWPNPSPEGSENTVTVTATNFGGSDDESWQLKVMLPPIIADIADESVRMNDSYTATPVLAQGTSPVSWSLVSSPSGMTIDSLTGQVSWSSAAIEGVHIITIRATNAVGTNDKSWHLKVWNPPVISAIGDTAIKMGIAYTGPVPTLSAGTLPVEWTLSTGPAGMTINAATGIVSWPNPSPQGSDNTVTITATNFGGSDDESWQLKVMLPPIIEAITDSTINEGLAYTGPAPSLSQGTEPVSWSMIAGPSGMTINPSTGVVSWTPVSSYGSPHTITIKASNAIGIDQKSWVLNVVSIPVINTISNASVGEGAAYTGPLPSLSKGTAPITWSLVSWPAGMTIDSLTGVVSWPAADFAGSPHKITIRAGNAAGSGEKSWNLSVIRPPIINEIGDAITTSGIAYTGPRPTTSQGTVPFQWSLVQGPAGMMINPSNGIVYWPNPTEVGSPQTVTIRAANPGGSDDESWQIAVMTPPVIETISNASIKEFKTYSMSPTLSQGTLPVTWSLINAPVGMTIDASTGEISWLSPSALTSQYNITLRASNPVGHYDRSWQLTVLPSYNVSISTDVDVAPAGNSVLLTGYADWLDESGHAPDVNVIIRVYLKDTKRVFPVKTNSSGAFELLFKPFADEAGMYSVSAEHPAVIDDVVQDQFVLVGMKTNPSDVSEEIKVSEPQTGQIQLSNLGDTELTLISAAVQNLPANLNIDVNVPGTIAPLGYVNVGYTVTANDDSTKEADPIIKFTSSEGADINLPMSIYVRPMVAELRVFPTRLEYGMTRGEQTIVQLTIWNEGTSPTGSLKVIIPNVPWMSLSSPAAIETIEPGQTQVVTIALRPNDTLTLGNYTGTIVVAGQTTGATVPFEFTAISSKIGNLLISAVDEFTYYGEGSPKVSDANVTISNAVTDELIVSGSTNAQGELLAENLPEAYYKIDISAVKHQDYHATILVVPGKTKEVIAFMPRQLVTYTWVVVPTQIEDKYEFVLETTFETDVPAPVITIEPAVFNLDNLTGESIQVDYTLTNHGLIAASNARFSFGEHSRYEFTPLVEKIGDIPAKSSVVVPVLITDKQFAGNKNNYLAKSSALFMQDGAALENNSDDKCKEVIKGGCYYELKCGPDNRLKYVPVRYEYKSQECPPEKPLWPDYIEPNEPKKRRDPNIPPGGDGGGGGGGGWGGIITDVFTRIGFSFDWPEVTIPPSVAEGIPCNPCSFNLSKAIASCAWSYLPTDCPEGVIIGLANTTSNCYRSGVVSWDCFETLLLEAAGAGADCAGEVYGFIWKTGNCIYNIGKAAYENCGTKSESSTMSSMAKANVEYLSSAPDDIDPYVAQVMTQADRIKKQLDALVELFGDSVWLDGQSEDTQVFKTWMTQYSSAVSPGGEEGVMVSENEWANLLSIPRPRQITDADIDKMLSRWNRTVDYGNRGIYDLNDVPSGESTDFIARDVLLGLMDSASAAAQANIDEGFENMLDGPYFTVELLKDSLTEQPQGVCAKVKIQIKQDAVISRDAFAASLEINNGNGIASMDNMSVKITITDENNVDAMDKFVIYPPELSGISDVDGDGSIPAGGTALAKWTIVPTRDAVPVIPKAYYVGGEFSYTNDGVIVTMPLYPDSIMVGPDASLNVRYFHERTVYSDDPFTPEIEPAVPYSLGLIMTNKGAGQANRVRITSAQPQIIENEKGLLADFKLIGTQVGSEEVTPSLAVNLGNIPPNHSAVARWLMSSSIQGTFTQYSATYTHINGLGEPKLSLIDSLEIHELIHVVRADYPIDDKIVDFLVNDINDVNSMADTLYLSDGTIEPVDAFTDAVLDVHQKPTTVMVELSASVGASWNYIMVPNPVDSGLYLVSAIRSDGKFLLTGYNAWTTNRMIRKQGQEPYAEKLIHIFDYAGTGSYTLVFASEPIYGSLKVILSPADAIAAGAQWKLDNGDWMNSNDTLDWISSGTHTLSFKDINDWTAPAAGHVLITAGQTQELSATFLSAGIQTGSLTVTIEPQQAIDDGAYWRIDGGSIHHGSSELVAGLTAGKHLVQFATVNGWVEPNSQEIVIEADQTATTNGTYTKAMYALVAAAAGGNGTLSAVAGIYETGTVVALTAYPNADYRVKSWSGTDNVPAAGNASNTVTMNADKTVSVTFEPLPANARELNVQIIGGGYVQPDAGFYNEGTIVVLTANPQDNFRVKSWTGTDNVPAANTNINTVTMTENKTVTVEFEPIPAVTFTLTTHIPGGYGTIAPSGGSYPPGTVVSLLASPDNGYRVKAWHGSDNDSSKANENSITMNHNRSVRIEFEPIIVTVPAVAAVMPNSGPVGSYIRITGTNFGETAGIVRFDGFASDDIISWSGEEILCKVLAAAPGPNTVDIGIERADGTDCVAVDAFETVPSSTIYTDANNVSGVENGTAQYPFSRIQRAVNASTNGCNILVLAGIYAGSGNRDISIIDKVVSLRSLNGPSATIIDCENSARAFYLQDINDANCLIRGFTIRNGFAEGNGGVLYLRSASPTIEQCIIIDSTATGIGGAIFCDGSSPRLINCTIAGNSSTSGHALGCISDTGCGTAIVTNSILWNGGNEIYTEGCSAVTMSYSEIIGDWPGEGNIDSDPCFADVLSDDYHLSPYSPCIDAGDPNSDYHLEPEPDGGRINMGAYGNTYEATSKGGLVLLSYNFQQKLRAGRTSFNYTYTMTLQNNSTTDLANVHVTMLTASAGISIIDPFVTFDSINAGEVAKSNNTFTINVNTLVPIDMALISWQATFDIENMGSFIESFKTRIFLEPRQGDLTDDGKVDYKDLAKLAFYWLENEPSVDIAPPGGDDIINFLDYAILAENWMAGTE